MSHVQHMGWITFTFCTRLNKCRQDHPWIQAIGLGDTILTNFFSSTFMIPTRVVFINKIPSVNTEIAWVSFAICGGKEQAFSNRNVKRQNGTPEQNDFSYLISLIQLCIFPKFIFFQPCWNLAVQTITSKKNWKMKFLTLFILNFSEADKGRVFVFLRLLWLHEFFFLICIFNEKYNNNDSCALFMPNTSVCTWRTWFLPFSFKQRHEMITFEVLWRIVSS